MNSIVNSEESRYYEKEMYISDGSEGPDGWCSVSVLFACHVLSQAGCDNDDILSDG